MKLETCPFCGGPLKDDVWSSLPVHSSKRRVKAHARCWMKTAVWDPGRKMNVATLPEKARSA